MHKKIIILIMFLIVIIQLSSCSITRKPLNYLSDFDTLLTEIEVNIVSDNWNKALKNTDNADKSWRTVKPLLQIDVDHDYINNIEDNLIRLKVYIETQKNTEALVTVRLIKDFWNTIGEM